MDYSSIDDVALDRRLQTRFDAEVLSPDFRPGNPNYEPKSTATCM